MDLRLFFGKLFRVDSLKKRTDRETLDELDINNILVRHLGGQAYAVVGHQISYFDTVKGAFVSTELGEHFLECVKTGEVWPVEEDVEIRSNKLLEAFPDAELVQSGFISF